jgi:hypothetical protein
VPRGIVFAALVPHVHSKLASHIAIGFSLRSHRRESVPDLLASGIGPVKLNPNVVTGEGAIMNVKEVSSHVFSMTKDREIMP